MPILQPKEFLLYYAVGTLIAILLFMRGRRPRGMQLKLGGKRGLDDAQASRMGEKPDSRAGASRGAEPSPPREVNPAEAERMLNVMFNYNGHSWDAYEVLDLPAGANIARVREARESALEKVDPSSRDFIEAAYRAILSRV